MTTKEGKNLLDYSNLDVEDYGKIKEHIKLRSEELERKSSKNPPTHTSRTSSAVSSPEE